MADAIDHHQKPVEVYLSPLKLKKVTGISYVLLLPEFDCLVQPVQRHEEVLDDPLLNNMCLSQQLILKQSTHSPLLNNMCLPNSLS
jgi:hypothetical protein